VWRVRGRVVVLFVVLNFLGLVVTLPVFVAVTVFVFVASKTSDEVGIDVRVSDGNRCESMILLRHGVWFTYLAQSTT
jgi:hypothetical protein